MYLNILFLEMQKELEKSVSKLLISIVIPHQIGREINSYF